MPGAKTSLVRRIVLIDGRSGAGKSTLASALASELPGAYLLRLDEVYPGWHGLDRASAALPRILRTGAWRSWDWSADRPGQWRRLPTGGLLVVEGVGALSRQSRALADLAVWVELPERERQRRALARDGERYAPYWRMWAAQECRFIARDRPTQLADAILSASDARANLAALRRLIRPFR